MTTMRKTQVVALASLFCQIVAALATDVLVEAESLLPPPASAKGAQPPDPQFGGFWVLDQQFIDQVGSSYLMAHGLGKPVADVQGGFTVSEPGLYRVLVRTKDWYAPHGVGKFQVAVDDKVMTEVLGAKGEGKWIWQEAGRVDLTPGEHRVALKDLTGLHGRCDAILFTTDAKATPPDGGAREQQPWRRKLRGLPEPTASEVYDLVVVGGGQAGQGAAGAAARLGLKVVLIDNLPRLGGATGRGIGSPTPDELAQYRYPSIWKTFEAIKADKNPPGNLSVIQEWHVYDVVKDGTRIAAVLAVHTRTGEAKRVDGRLFVDATGDGNLGVLAGNPVMYGQEGQDVFGEPAAPKESSRETMGSNVDIFFAEPKKGEADYPVPDWTAMDPFGKEFWKNPDRIFNAVAGRWFNESGFFASRPEDDELVRDRTFVRYYCAQSFLHHHADEVGGADSARKKGRIVKMNWMLQKRESRRLVGDIVMREQDFWVVKGTGKVSGQGWMLGGTPAPEARQFEDGCASTIWHMDVQVSGADNGNRKSEESMGISSNWWFGCGGLRTNDKKEHPVGMAHIPFRSLYAKDVPNLLMAGRDISVSRLALGMMRVQSITSQMGVAVGCAAAVCRKHNCTPRETYEKHLAELKAAWSLPPEATGLVVK